MTSRKFLLTLTVAAALVPSMGVSFPALAGPIRREERRERRVIRRRIRRHILWRTVAGRRLLVVPLAVAVGEELAIDNRVVVVKEDTPENTRTEEGTEY